MLAMPAFASFSHWAELPVLTAYYAATTALLPCRAFAGYWSVAATEETAMNGCWRLGPGIGLFEAISAQLGQVPILAEDLGVITTDVVELR